MRSYILTLNVILGYRSACEEDGVNYGCRFDGDVKKQSLPVSYLEENHIESSTRQHVHLWRNK